MRYVFSDYELDDQLYELRCAGEPVELERKVYDVLVYLIQHHDRLVTKDELLDKLWPGQVVGEVALTRCIPSARKALGDDGNRQEFIKTQYGRGYRFVAPVAASAAPVPITEKIDLPSPGFHLLFPLSTRFSQSFHPHSILIRQQSSFPRLTFL